MSCPDAAAVFAVVPINHVVATVFDAPMFAVGLQDFLGIRFFWASSWSARKRLRGYVHPFFVDAFPLDYEGLADMGKSRYWLSAVVVQILRVSVRP